MIVHIFMWTNYHLLFDKFSSLKIIQEFKKNDDFNIDKDQNEQLFCL